jgi:hypothetical protein
MSFKIIDLETGYFEEVNFVGAEQDSGGKSLQQAITQCTKYFYFKLFKISSKDEVDGDTQTVTASQSAPKAQSTNDGEDGKPWLNEGKGKWDELVAYCASKGTDKVRDKYKVSKATFAALEAAIFEYQTARADSQNHGDVQ